MAAKQLPQQVETKPPPVDSPAVDFALVLSRVIGSARGDPAELRSAIYELARIKLQQQCWQRNPPVDILEMRRLTMALETAIDRVEAISLKEDNLKALKSLDRLVEDLSRSDLQNGPEAASAVLTIENKARESSHIVGPATPNPTFTLSKFANAPPHSRKIPRFTVLRPIIITSSLVLVACIALAFYGKYPGVNFLVKARAPHSAIEQTPTPTAATPESSSDRSIGISRPTPSSEPDQANGFPLPSVYGIYAVNEGSLFELEALPGRIPDQRIFMSAIIAKPSLTIIPSGQISFIAYRRDLATTAPARISVRVIARVTRALTIDQRGKAQITPIDDAWAVRNVEYVFRVSPTKENPEVLLMRPENPNVPLPPGRYGMVLNGVAYDFTVAGEVTGTVHCLERTVAANGTFYSECRRL